MSHSQVAIVTGGNRGLGLETSRQLLQQQISVYFTSRSVDAGEQALKQLRPIAEQYQASVFFYQLDVIDFDALPTFCEHVQQQSGRVDILVNNAGIFPDSPEQASMLNTPVSAFCTTEQQLTQAIQTNTFAPFMLCQQFLPLMREQGYGRVVNVSSGLGQLDGMNGGFAAYRISKTAINAVTRIFADEMQDCPDVLINSVCPGWVRTDMGGTNADRSPEEGVETIVWLATLPAGSPSGGFFRDKQLIAW